MSEHEASTANAGMYNPLKKHHFLLRRLHSLSGIVPIGLFVIMHLFTNFQQITGDYQHEVEFIHHLPALLFLEITIWVSIGFHAGLGFYYISQGKSNTKRYPYMDNWRYSLQRWTGVIALLFIFLHVSTLRWRWTYFGLLDTPFYVASSDGQPLVAATTSAAIQASVWVLLIYIIGVAAVVYHWSNGLWTAAISWGLTLTPSSQKRWGYVCAAMAVVLTVFSVGAIGAAWVRPVTDYEHSLIMMTSEEYRQGVPLRERAADNELLSSPDRSKINESPSLSAPR